MIKASFVPFFIYLILAGSAPILSSTPAAEPGPRAELGSDIFAALAETVETLLADEATNWDRVNILALREHLVDMSSLVVDSIVTETTTPNGLEIRLTGNQRVLEAAGRMLPMHTSMMTGYRGWSVAIDKTADTFKLSISSSEEAERTKIRALGFFGFMSLGNHHQIHHKGLATGTMMKH